jgi:hypothetical protein
VSRNLACGRRRNDLVIALAERMYFATHDLDAEPAALFRHQLSQCRAIYTVRKSGVILDQVSGRSKSSGYAFIENNGPDAGTG